MAVLSRTIDCPGSHSFDPWTPGRGPLPSLSSAGAISFGGSRGDQGRVRHVDVVAHILLHPLAPHDEVLAVRSRIVLSPASHRAASLSACRWSTPRKEEGGVIRVGNDLPFTSHRSLLYQLSCRRLPSISSSSPSPRLPQPGPLNERSCTGVWRLECPMWFGFTRPRRRTRDRATMLIDAHKDRIWCKEARSSSSTWLVGNLTSELARTNITARNTSH